MTNSIQNRIPFASLRQPPVVERPLMSTKWYHMPLPNKGRQFHAMRVSTVLRWIREHNMASVRDVMYGLVQPEWEHTNRYFTGD
jgi:hypothetical protein